MNSHKDFDPRFKHGVLAIDINPIKMSGMELVTGLGGLALSPETAPTDELEKISARNEFFIKSPDHNLITEGIGVEFPDEGLGVNPGNDMVSGMLGFSVTRGAGFGERGQLAFMDIDQAADPSENEEIRTILTEEMRRVASKNHGLENLYLQESDPEVIEIHKKNGATTKEAEVTYRYDVEKVVSNFVDKSPFVPEGYSLQLLDEYKEQDAVAIAALMPQLDSSFSSELTEDRVSNYRYIIISPNYDILVVRNEEGKVVGSLSLTKMDGETWQLEDVILDEKQRGKGLGKAMMMAMNTEAHKKGIKQIFLQTEEIAVEGEIHRPGAAKLYSNTGAEKTDLKTLEYKAN